MNKKRIVICGSMSFYNQMISAQNLLTKNLIPSVLPDDDENMALNLSTQKFEEYKRKISFQYLKKIKNPKTWSILVINPKKHDISSYIGPNTFAEIAVAFSNKKKVYLMYGIPNVYEDELLAWRAISLNGIIDTLLYDYKEVCYRENSQLQLVAD
jgi:hypothetical protein